MAYLEPKDETKHKRKYRDDDEEENETNPAFTTRSACGINGFLCRLQSKREATN